MFLNEKSRLLFVIGFRSLVLNYAYLHDVVVSNWFKQHNYIWFINIILNLMHFFKDSLVFFYCFEENVALVR